MLYIKEKRSMLLCLNVGSILRLESEGEMKQFLICLSDKQYAGTWFNSKLKLNILLRADFAFICVL